MKFKDWVFLFLLNVIPVILVHFIARIFWTNQGDNTPVATFETLFTMIILPICLLFNYSVDKVKAMNRFGVWIMMVFTLGLSTVLGFKNWADAVGSWKHPYSETSLLGNYCGCAIEIFCWLRNNWDYYANQPCKEQKKNTWLSNDTQVRK